MLIRKYKPSDYFTAHAQNGVIQLETKEFLEQVQTDYSRWSRPQYVIIGASCPTSANIDDGLISNAMIIPRTEKEVVAIALVTPLTEGIFDAMILCASVNSSGVAIINLEKPFESDSRLAVSLFLTRHAVQLRIITNEKKVFSRPWFLPDRNWGGRQVSYKDEIRTSSQDLNDCDLLCKVIVGAASL
ncbi:MAG: hypothetical protein WCT02_01895 [Candidatus Paceibacterota bacterium]|jgi:hypothetical protein